MKKLLFNKFWRACIFTNETRSNQCIRQYYNITDENFKKFYPVKTLEPEYNSKEIEKIMLEQFQQELDKNTSSTIIKYKVEEELSKIKEPFNWVDLPPWDYNYQKLDK